MKVKFVVEYYYDPNEDYPFHAEVELHMPTDGERKDYIHPMLQSRRHKVFGTVLYRTAGRMDNERGTIYLRKTVCGQSWEDVKQEVASKVAEALATLKEVKKANEQALETKPGTEEFEFEI